MPSDVFNPADGLNIESPRPAGIMEVAGRGHAASKENMSDSAQRNK
jgi:hypothetical protein